MRYNKKVYCFFLIFFLFVNTIFSEENEAEKKEIILDSASPAVKFAGSWQDSSLLGGDLVPYKISAPKSAGSITVSLTQIPKGKYLLYYTRPVMKARWQSDNFDLIYKDSSAKLKYIVDLSTTGPGYIPENPEEKHFCGFCEITNSSAKILINSTGADKKIVPFHSIILEKYETPPLFNSRLYRGMNVWAKELKESDVDYLVNYLKVNVLRLKLDYEMMTSLQNEKSKSWTGLTEIIGYINKKKCLAIVSVDSVNGRVLKTDTSIFTEKKDSEDFIFFWAKFASLVDSFGLNVVYDLLNYPFGAYRNEFLDEKKLAENSGLFTRAINEIRKIDAENYILFQFPDFINFPALNTEDEKIIYGLNFYYPEEFTQQRIRKEDRRIVNYPVKTANNGINEQSLCQKFGRIINCLKVRNKPFIITEFSVIRWAPVSDSYKYLNDCIALFENLGYSWIFSDYVKSAAFNGYSVIYGTNRFDETVEKNDSEKIKQLREKYSENKQ